MGAFENATGTDARKRADQLDRSDGQRTLTNTDRDGFTGKPFLMVVAHFPFWRGHDTRGFIRQIDASLLSQAEHVRPFGDHVDAHFFRKRVERKRRRTGRCPW